MLIFNEIIAVLLLHFLGDFILQSDKIAKTKSTNLVSLTQHVAIYFCVLLYFGFWFAFFNAILHFIIDFCTSRINKKLYENEQRHWFFVVIGFDQMLHYMSLFFLLKII